MNNGNHHRHAALTLLAGIALAASAPAFAYVGPGAGLSLIGALWAVVATVAAALFFVVLWPIRRMIKRRTHAPAKGAAGARADSARQPMPPA